MSERITFGTEGVQQKESLRPRLTVKAGPRGSFPDKERAMQRGVETIDPVHDKGSAISSISTLNKRSLGYTVCPGLVFLAKDASGENISFTTHQVPMTNPEFLREYKEKISTRLQEFVTRARPGSIDAAFFCGEQTGDADAQSAKNAWYETMREALGEVVRSVAGVEPRLVDRPNREGESADVFLDTQAATLYIER